ncbi:beta-lactamase domain-containing protein [Metarhizium brunneum]
MAGHRDPVTLSGDAYRGFVASVKPCIIQGKNGQDIWDASLYEFLQEERPDTVNRKLWQHSRLTSLHGLFEVLPGIYQVRGFDVSNMTILEGKEGIIVIDPLVSEECAAAALSLYHTHRGSRPVEGVIYSHSHVDHFGGVVGVLPQHKSVPIIAPVGFMEEAVSENVLAGPAMHHRAGFMYGVPLPRTSTGQVGVGIGMSVSRGTSSLVPPNTLIHETGQALEIDGVKLVFQMVPETEAPAEINLYLPDKKALYISECAVHSLHNVITLRGALVRNAKSWSAHLDETIDLYATESDVLFAGHHWPTWGTENLVQHITEQRDLYAYLHDQTLRMMNMGLNGTEIAEKILLPPRLRDAPHAQGFYGSVSHNVKGIYQRYMTWFDGNPANLWKLTPAEEGIRYVDCFGGIQKLVERAEAFAALGDLRFAAALLDHAVKAEPTAQTARRALASVFEKLGYGAENATWRNFYLTAALELRFTNGQSAPTKPFSPPLNPQGSVEQWLDSLSIKIDGLEAAKEDLTIHIQDAEAGSGWRIRVSNGALTHRCVKMEDVRTLRSRGDGNWLVLSKEDIFVVLNGDVDLARSKATGNCEALEKLLKLCGVLVQGQGAAGKM